MRGLWRNFWLRSLVFWPAAIGISLASIWCVPILGRPLAVLFGIANALQANEYFYFTPAMLLMVLPAIPFWILAEPRLWSRRDPFPLGSYLVFLIVFFLSFYVSAYLDVYGNQNNAFLGMVLLIASYLGAGGIGRCCRFWLLSGMASPTG